MRHAGRTTVMRHGGAVLVVAFLSVFPLDGRAGTAVPRVAVPRLDAKDAAPEIGVALSELVAFELEETGRYSVVTNEDIARVLKLKGQQQQLGCDTPACAADLGRTMEVDQLVAGSVTKLGRTYLVILKLLDARNASVVKQIRGQSPAEEDRLIDTVGDLTRKLVAKAELVRNETTPAPSPMPAPPPPPDVKVADKDAKTDDAIATGNMWGSETGDAFGAGGLGLSGTGQGGGGMGTGIGLGSIGTIGRGSGSGRGYGSGSGRLGGGSAAPDLSRNEELRLATRLRAKLARMKAKQD